MGLPILSSAYDYSQIPYANDTTDTGSDPFAGYNGLGDIGPNIGDSLSQVASFNSGMPIQPVDLTGNTAEESGISSLIGSLGGVIHVTSYAPSPASTTGSSGLIWILLLAVGGYVLMRKHGRI